MLTGGGGAAFLFLIMASAMLMFSCSGTGGVSVIGDDGETYGGSSASGAGSGSGGSSAGGMTDSNGGELSAWDILEKTNAGQTKDVVNILSGSGPVQEERTDGPGKFSIALPADAFGIPADGYAVLEILGGDEPYKGSYTVSDDGMIHFDDVSKVPVNAEITVILTGYAADDTVVCSGVSTGVATSKGLEVSISPLGGPSIGLSNGTPNGNTATIGGVDYEVVEYTGSGLAINALTTDSSATLSVTVNDSTVSPTATLSDGCNTIVATAARSQGAPVSTTRNVFAVRKLSKDDITITPSNYASIEDAGDGKLLRYSYLSSTAKPKVSVVNGYSSTGDAGTSAIGASKMAISVSGKTTVGTTEDLTNQELELGESTVTVTLYKPLCTPVTVSKSYTVKIKPVKVTVSGSIKVWCWQKDGSYTMKSVKHHLKASNNPGGEYCGSVLVVNKSNVAWGSGDNYIAPTDANACVWLTDPDSKFGFWTEQLEENAKSDQFGKVPENDGIMSRLLKDLKGNKSFDSKDRDWSGGTTTDDKIRRSRYYVTVSLDDSTDPPSTWP